MTLHVIAMHTMLLPVYRMMYKQLLKAANRADWAISCNQLQLENFQLYTGIPWGSVMGKQSQQCSLFLLLCN